VLDLPGSAIIGREIIAAAGMSDRVRHREGDAVTADLGRSYDGVLCFNLVHHLQPEQIVGLLRRIHDALAPGGSLAVMDQVQTPAELHGWLAEAGFGAPRRIPILCIPGPARYVVTRR
jgi:chemotaxis methyl-accepting protein methylase